MLRRRSGPLSLTADPFDMFNAFFGEVPLEEGISLKARVEENKDDYTFVLEIPGFDENEISIEVKERVLEIAAEHKESSTEKHFYRKVQRAWQLPKGIDEDSVKASLKNGVLTVTVPKKALPAPKKVEVKLLKE